MRKIKILILLFVVFISNISNINAQSKAVFLTDSTSWADSVLLTLSEEERIKMQEMLDSGMSMEEVIKKMIEKKDSEAHLAQDISNEETLEMHLTNC